MLVPAFDVDALRASSAARCAFANIAAVTGSINRSDESMKTDVLLPTGAISCSWRHRIRWSHAGAHGRSATPMGRNFSTRSSSFQRPTIQASDTGMSICSSIENWMQPVAAAWAYGNQAKRTAFTCNLVTSAAGCVCATSGRKWPRPSDPRRLRASSAHSRCHWLSTRNH